MCIQGQMHMVLTDTRKMRHPCNVDKFCCQTAQGTVTMHLFSEPYFASLYKEVLTWEKLGGMNG